MALLSAHLHTIDCFMQTVDKINSFYNSNLRALAKIQLIYLMVSNTDSH